MKTITADDIALLLSEGLDLCVRAQKLDRAMEEAIAAGDGRSDGRTRCLTPALWVQDQYDRDLAAWQERARAGLTIWTFENQPVHKTQPPRPA